MGVWLKSAPSELVYYLRHLWARPGKLMITSRRVLQCSRECEKWNLWKISHTPSGPQKKMGDFFSIKKYIFQTRKKYFWNFEIFDPKISKNRKFSKEKIFSFDKISKFSFFENFEIFREKIFFSIFKMNFLVEKNISEKKLGSLNRC